MMKRHESSRARLNGQPVFDIEPLAFPPGNRCSSESREIFSPLCVGSLMITRPLFAIVRSSWTNVGSSRRLDVLCTDETTIYPRGKKRDRIFNASFYSSSTFFLLHDDTSVFVSPRQGQSAEIGEPLGVSSVSNEEQRDIATARD